MPNVREAPNEDLIDIYADTEPTPHEESVVREEILFRMDDINSKKYEKMEYILKQMTKTEDARDFLRWAIPKAEKILDNE